MESECLYVIINFIFRFRHGYGQHPQSCSRQFVHGVLETQLVSKLPLHHLIKSWYRYVNDILVVLSHDFPLQQFLTQMNSLVASFKFTFEPQNNEGTSFLDLLIIRKGR